MRMTRRNVKTDQATNISNSTIIRRETVSWYEAMAFCRWLSTTPCYAEIGGVTLPTEFQWEKAARGPDGLKYPYGNVFDSLKANTEEGAIDQTSAVGIFPDGASPYGVCDMSGNVWEWTLTKYTGRIDARVDSNGTRVPRGGSWSYDRNMARAGLSRVQCS